MSKIPMRYQYRLAVMRYTNNSDLLPPSMSVLCGGLQAQVKADVNYLLPVFIIRALSERYALQHKEVRGSGVKAGIMRQYETKRVTVNIEYEVLPEWVEGYQKLTEFMAKLEDKTSDEFKEFLSVDGKGEEIYKESLFFKPEIPITELDFSLIKPQPKEVIDALNRESYVRNPNDVVDNQSEVNALRQVNSLLSEKLAKQGSEISELKDMMREFMKPKRRRPANSSPQLAEVELEEQEEEAVEVAVPDVEVKAEQELVSA